jgi:hypothetical protein
MFLVPESKEFSTVTVTTYACSYTRPSLCSPVVTHFVEAFYTSRARWLALEVLIELGPVPSSWLSHVSLIMMCCYHNSPLVTELRPSVYSGVQTCGTRGSTMKVVGRNLFLFLQVEHNWNTTTWVVSEKAHLYMASNTDLIKKYDLWLQQTERWVAVYSTTRCYTVSATDSVIK